MATGRIPINGTAAIQSTIVDAKGDLIAATADNTVARLAVGANDTVLVADSAEATGLKWAAPAGANANFSLLNAGGTALSGVSTRTVSGISGQSTLVVLIEDASTNATSSEIVIRLNTDTGANYTNFGANLVSPSSYGAGNLESTSFAGVTGIYVGRMPTSASGAVCAGATIIGCNAAGFKMFDSVGSGNAVSTFDQRADWAQGFYSGASTISSVSVVSMSGNFDAGRMYIYGSAV